MDANDKKKKLEEAILELFVGLYDPPSAQALGADVRGAASGPRVRLLNPRTTDDDATVRRFAMLEVD